MNNLARKLDTGEVFQRTGTVVRSGASSYGVRTSEGEHDAKRAASCLVEPSLGDYVLCALVPTGACYVLGVLERSDGTRTNLVVEGDVSLKVPSGRLELAAQQGVALISASDVTIASSELRVNALDGNVTIGRLSYLGQRVRSEVERVKHFATSVDSVLERLTQRVKRVYRVVEDFDQLRAQRIDYRAEKTMSLHAKNAVVTAEQLVKMDGEQIHLG